MLGTLSSHSFRLEVSKALSQINSFLHPWNLLELQIVSPAEDLLSQKVRVGQGPPISVHPSTC